MDSAPSEDVAAAMEAEGATGEAPAAEGEGQPVVQEAAAGDVAEAAGEAMPLEDAAPEAEASPESSEESPEGAAKVIRQGDESTFAQSLPSSVWVDSAAIEGRENWDNPDKVKLSADDPHIVFNYEGYDAQVAKKSDEGDGTRTISIAYANEDGSDLANGEYVVDGSIYLTFKDAVTLYDGTKADLVAEYTNIKIYFTGTDTTKAFAIIHSYSLQGDAEHLRSDPQNSLQSLEFDVIVSIQKDGAAVNQNMLLTVVDLDASGIKQDALGTQETTKIRSFGADAAYIESLQIKSGATTDAYVPTGNFLNIDEESLKFTGTKADGTTFNSGFAIMLSGAGHTLH